MDIHKFFRFVCLTILGLFCVLYMSAAIAQVTKPVPIYDPARRKINLKPMPRRPSPRDNSGNSCSLITFEGLGDLAAIPSFYGVNLPDWLSIIEHGAGGSGNFASEPSPVTIAFWLTGEPTFQSIQIPNGASQISLYYSSYYAITLTALDAKGNTLTTVSGDPNFDTGTSVYDVWSQLTITAPSDTVITTLNVAGYANYTGIDDLNVCQSPALAAVEPTQAIQQYQLLSDLKTSLKANGQPPVPMVAGKPAALRLYFTPVQTVSNVTVNLSGVSTDSKSVTLLPTCQPEDQRAGTGGCQSVDFYFTPPTGSWTATIDVLDSSGQKIEEEVLPFTSVTTASLRVRGVSICDSNDSTGTPQCGQASDILSNTALIGKIFPAPSVTVDATSSLVFRDVTDTTTYKDPLDWWVASASGVNSLWGVYDHIGDFLAGRRTTYFGMTRAAAATDPAFGGWAGYAAGIPGHGALSLSSETYLGYDLVPETVAHETGHTLGGRHTDTKIPSLGGALPGCWGDGGNGATYWPFGDNYIQTAQGGKTTYEIGFDVSTGTPIAKQSHLEVMSYCAPTWISPQSYMVMMNTLLNNPATTTPAALSNLRPATSGVAGQFWQVSGTIAGSSVVFDPLFELPVQGDTTTETGTYSIEVQNGGGTALFTRLFTPSEIVSDPAPGSPTTTSSDTSAFSETIPVASGAAAIVVKDASKSEIGRISLSGTPPAVTLNQPASTESGSQPITWSVTGPSSYWSKLLYSADNGANWSLVSDEHGKTSQQVNFDMLPGSSQALLQVLVSDGVNTGSATSANFSVPKKKPSIIRIDSPAVDYAQPAANVLYMSGSVFDVDDGVLSGSTLVWSDSAQGTLGTGSPFSMKLKPGKHTITLTGTDSDGNALATSVDVTLGGAPPVVNLAVQALNSVPTTCEYATLSASPGAQGAPLSQVQYSVDGGTTYITVPLGSLPYGFLVPGSGFLHVVVRAYDISGQLGAQDATFFIQSGCTLTTQTITFAALNDVTYGVAPITLNATATSSLPVTYAVTGPATVSGLILTIIGVGEVTVTAEQAGDSTYAPATWVSHTFNVVEATPSVTWAAPAPISYGTSLAGVLNASTLLGKTSVPGAYAYTAQPTGGAAATVSAPTILTPGVYKLAVTFTPTDATDINSASATVSLTVDKETPTLAVTSSANPVIADSAVTLTANLTAAYGNPSGTVNFLDGTTTLGSGIIAGGVATYATNTLAAGSHSITAVYSGDTNFVTVTSGSLAQIIQDFVLNLGSGGSSQTVTAGGAATYSFSVAPVGGSTIPASVSFSASGLPSGATATFNPATVASGSAATSVTLTVQTSSAKAGLSPWNAFGTGAAVTSLCLILLPFTRRMRTHGRRFNRLFPMVLFLVLGAAATAAISGCGGSTGMKQSQSSTSTVTVSATAGALTHTTTLTLTVN
jgi:hypothetical protein